jgi:hypothetical protein
MEIVSGILIGIVLTAGLIYLYVRGLVREVMAELDQHIDRVASTLMPVIVERENDQLFCYTKEDHQFICQGATVAEIRAAFARRFPDRTAYLDGGDPVLVEELRAELQKDLHAKVD